jgi:short-subunit dehydrogenase
MDENSLIFNVGSDMGINPTENRTAYCSSKFGLRGLSLCLNKELKKDVCLLTLGSVMDNFGTGGIKKRKELASKGKKYLKVSQVINKILEVVDSNEREAEYKLYA